VIFKPRSQIKFVNKSKNQFVFLKECKTFISQGGIFSAMIIGNLNKGDYTIASFKVQSLAQNTSLGVASSSTGYAGTNSGGIGRIGQGNSAGSNSLPEDSGFAQGARNRTFGGQMNNTANIIQVQIDYTNTLGERESLTKEVKMTSTSSGSAGVGAGARLQNGRTAVAAPSFFSKYKWYLLIFAVIILSWFFYHRYNQVTLKNPKASLKDVLLLKK